MPSTKLILLIICILGLWWLRSPPSPLPSQSHPTAITRRIVAVADLHGDYDHALSVLKMAGVIEESASRRTAPKWLDGSGQTVLVSTGDLVDRGDDTQLLYQLFDTLRSQAPSKEHVRNCIGNHEMMNALSDWRYVTRGDIDTFPGGVAGRRQAMSTSGWIGQTWLANYSLSHTIDLLPHEEIRQAQLRRGLTSSYLVPQANFVHGGIHPTFAEASLAKLNEIAHSLLHRALQRQAGPASASSDLFPPNTPDEERRLYSEMGPLWYRGYATDADEGRVCSTAKQARRFLAQDQPDVSVDYLVMGHTPHLEGFVHRCEPPSVHLIDTGISRAYGGAQSALVFETTLTEGKTKDEWTEERRLVALYRGRKPKVVYERTRKV
ncbi:Metallo-dependent phosphatase [Jaminaea rosea]|uniref:Metallo-dependent phosphatase n=1 Tax=Jaminaea rosea TaxID=1569628 RepID=A0A316UT65_9BASI|nr:Metallo-dependent phosphatase [Jaminaea rosea]PWN28194.1 Metallo-dependent phosphatase [Jaminaea rosea]